MCKERIDQLEVGDKVVIDNGNHYGASYKVATVEKLTATQLTIGGERFNRRDGVRIGDGDRYSYRTQLATAYYPNHRLMTIEEAETANRQKEQEQEIAILARKIKDASYSGLRKLPLETLQQVIKLLQLEDTDGKTE